MYQDFLHLKAYILSKILQIYDIQERSYGNF